MNENNVTTSGLFNPNRRMSSLEIAGLTGKDHKNILRDIRILVDQEAIGRLNFEPSSYLNSQNKEQSLYDLDFRATMILVTGYDVKRRAAVIDRWMKLETGEALPAGNLHNILCDVPVINHLISTVSDLMVERGKLDARLYQLETGRRKQQRITPTNVTGFLSATYRHDSNAAMDKRRIYSQYRDYCQFTATIQEPRDIFFKILYQQGLPLRPGKLSVAGRVTRVVRGFGLKSGVVSAANRYNQMELFPAGVLGNEEA